MHWRFVAYRFAAIAVLIPSVSCTRAAGPDSGEGGGKAMDMKLGSTAFEYGSVIPKKHTADGPNISPALVWHGVPEGTQAFALICDDPDAPAGTWVHWVLYDIPGTATNLPENVATDKTVPGIGTQGLNDFRRIGYGGPAPPRGKVHRYFFKLYSLDAATGLPPGQSKKRLLAAIKDHVLGRAELMGTYRR